MGGWGWRGCEHIRQHRSGLQQGNSVLEPQMLSPVRVHAPNITIMYSELFYTHSIHLNNRSLTPPSPEAHCVAPYFCLFSALRRASTYVGWGHLDISRGLACCWHPIGQTSISCRSVLACSNPKLSPPWVRSIQ